MKYPDFLSKGGIPVGMPCDFPPGSVERAKLLSLRILSAWELASTTEQAWEAEVGKARNESAHALLGFPDFDAYLDALTGKGQRERVERFRKAQQAARENQKALAPHGTNQYREDITDNNNVMSSSQGNASSYRIRKLRRDAPEIAHRLEVGEFKSVAAAERAARGEEPHPPRKVPSNYELAQRIVRKLSPADWKRLVRWRDEGMS